MNNREITRPNKAGASHLTFLWKPGVEIVELVHRDGKLVYAIWNGQDVKYSKTHGTLSPPSWIEDAVKKGSVKLPTGAERHGTLDDLADRMKDFIHRYFECGPVFESLAVAYALQTWMYEHFSAIPYLRFLGLWGTGKSRATEVIGSLCYRPVVLSGSSSAAALFRIIEPIGGTVLIDEADYNNVQLGGEVTKILNSGYQRGGTVWKVEKNSAGDFIPTAHDVFGPKIINGRKPFRDEATESRCLTHRPQRKTRPDIPVQLPAHFETEAREIRNRALDWRLRTFDTFDPNAVTNLCAVLDGKLNLNLEPRTLQIVGPLLAIVAKMDNPVPYVRHLIDFATAQERQVKDALRESPDAILVRAYLRLRKDGPPTCREIKMHIHTWKSEEDPDLVNPLSPRRISDSLRELGFQTTHTRDGSRVDIELEKLKGLCEKFGIDLAEYNLGG